MSDQNLNQPGQPHAGAHEAHHPHVIPIKVYIGVWAVLMVLTVVTVAASFVHIGFLNVPIALTIATIKATLVALIFMHLYYDEKFNALVLLAGVAFVIIFFTFTLIDPLTRGEVNADEGYYLAPEMPRAGVLKDHPGLLIDGATTGTAHDGSTAGEGARPDAALIDTHSQGTEPIPVEAH